MFLLEVVEMIKTEIIVAEIPQLLTVEDVAKILQVKDWTVYRLVKDKELKSIKVRGSIRFRPDDVKEYLEKGSVVK